MLRNQTTDSYQSSLCLSFEWNLLLKSLKSLIIVKLCENHSVFAFLSTSRTFTATKHPLDPSIFTVVRTFTAKSVTGSQTNSN